MKVPSTTNCRRPCWKLSRTNFWPRGPGSRPIQRFRRQNLDSMSVIDLGDHSGRLTVKDLRQLETRVPLDTLQRCSIWPWKSAARDAKESRLARCLSWAIAVEGLQPVRQFDPVKATAARTVNLASESPRGHQRNRPDWMARSGQCRWHRRGGRTDSDASSADITLSKGLGARIGPPLRSVAPPGSRHRGQRNERHGANLSGRRGDAADRALPPPDKWRGFEHEPPGSESTITLVAHTPEAVARWSSSGDPLTRAVHLDLRALAAVQDLRRQVLGCCRRGLVAPADLAAVVSLASSTPWWTIFAAIPSDGRHLRRLHSRRRAKGRRTTWT